MRDIAFEPDKKKVLMRWTLGKNKQVMRAAGERALSESDGNTNAKSGVCEEYHGETVHGDRQT